MISRPEWAHDLARGVYVREAGGSIVRPLPFDLCIFSQGIRRVMAVVFLGAGDLLDACTYVEDTLNMRVMVMTTIGAVFASLLFDRKRTWAGIRKGVRMFLGILPDLLIVLVAAAVLLALTPESVIIRLLGRGSGAAGIATAAIIGSVALVPGFIAFPLAAVLHRSGVSLDVIAVFITTLMMVGIITLPVERKYFGWKIALYRNGLSLAGALVVGLLMGLFL